MDTTHESFSDLIKRLDNLYHDLDNDIVVDMSHNDEEYAAMCKEVTDMQEAHPFIVDVTEGRNAVSLTVDEHQVLLQYLALIGETEDMERRQIYFRGHADCFAYLKRIGVI